MNTNTRACVAYIAAGLSELEKVISLYDHTENKPLSVSGSVSPATIDVYGSERSCHVSGSQENLYDYGNSAHIQIAVNSDKFSGYDYASKFHFSGTMEKEVVSLYDYETEVYYRYS